MLINMNKEQAEVVQEVLAKEITELKGANISLNDEDAVRRFMNIRDAKDAVVSAIQTPSTRERARQDA
jgi:hypothetical protein